MNEKVGRNDPCPCGSGKKYKSCCLEKESKPSTGLFGRKFKAKVLSGGGAAKQQEQNAQEDKKPIMPVDYNVLMERSFGDSLRRNTDKPPIPENPSEYIVEEDREEGNTKEMT